MMHIELTQFDTQINFTHTTQNNVCVRARVMFVNHVI